DAHAAFVFDYKTSPKSFSWSDFYHGLNVQMPLYLLAVEGRIINDSGPLAAVGAFFVPVQLTAKNTEAEQEDEDERTAQRRKSYGIFNGEYHRALDPGAQKWSNYYNYCVSTKGDQYSYYGISGAIRPDEFSRTMNYARRLIASAAGRILDGHIAVHPFRKGSQSPCSFCDYQPVCRFDWQINDYNFLRSMNKQQVLDVLGGGNA
ncbi:MAG TPA: PD-(D/E)XK nuclease family protein, partial [Sedimentisphaerales bacterium]|nr:PD-(D/E)XK nuclease family protein [Sedimentisphaerales bacterium]